MNGLLKVWAGPDGPEAEAEFAGRRFPVLIGRTGAIAAADKREGDGKTPLGRWDVLYGYYRADRVAKPAGPLLWQPIDRTMGWCDAPEDECYNLPVIAGYGASHEELWREDAAYDYILVTSHNTPPEPGMGSAVFVHLWREGAVCTAGCVALKKADMEAVLAEVAAVEIVAA